MDPKAGFWQTIIMNNHNFTYHNIYLRNLDRSLYGNFYTDIKYKTQRYIPIDLLVLSLIVHIFGDLIFFLQVFSLFPLSCRTMNFFLFFYKEYFKDLNAVKP